MNELAGAERRDLRRGTEYAKDTGELLLVSVFLALFLWLVLWAPTAVLAIASPSTFLHTYNSEWWARLGLEVGPVLADGVDPLMPTVLTVLLALCLIEIWRSAPRDLMGLGSLSAMLTMSWGWLAGTTLFSASLGVERARSALGSALVGIALVFLIAAVAGWMRHISPVGNENQARSLMRTIPELLQLESQYSRYLAQRPMGRPKLVLVVWWAPLAFAALAVLFVGFVNWAYLPSLATMGGIIIYCLWGALFVSLDLKDPPSSTDLSKRRRRVALAAAWTAWAIGVLLAAWLLFVVIPEVRWYLSILLLSSVWVALAISWRNSPLQVAISMRARVRLADRIANNWGRLRGAEERLLMAGGDGLLRLSQAGSSSRRS